MLTSEDSYKFMRERKRNSYADPKRISSLYYSGMSSEKSLYFILKIYVCCNLFFKKYRKKLSDCASSVIISETNFAAI